MMNRSTGMQRWIGVALVALSVLGCDSGTQPDRNASPGPISASDQVVDQQTGRPIAHAVVELYQSPDPDAELYHTDLYSSVASVRTDSLGRYALSYNALRLRKYVLLVNEPPFLFGFLKDEIDSVDLRKGWQPAYFWESIAVYPDQPHTGITALKPSASLRVFS